MAVLLACVAVAAASLALPFELSYDPWSWLVWGREITDLTLDTTAGPSWKPLPVAIDVPLSASGAAAPELWLVIARAGWLAAPVLAWRLAARLCSGRTVGVAAGATAALGVVLMEDPFTPWLRQFAAGLSEPLLVALVLLAVERALARRPGQALGAGAAAALLRPEAWPFLAAYALWCTRDDPRLRAFAVAGAVVIPLAWFVPDLLGSGDPLEGASTARSGPTGLGATADSLGRAAAAPLAAAWPLAAFAVLAAGRRGERVVPVLGAGALAWLALVATAAAAGYWGLPRFGAPATAIVCVLAGVGLAELARAIAERPAGARLGRPAAALAAAVALVLGTALFPALDLDDDFREAQRRATSTAALQATADRVFEPPSGCAPAEIDDRLASPALAWELELGLSEVRAAKRPSPRAGLAFTGGEWAEARSSLLGPAVASSGGWTAYAPCRLGAQASTPSNAPSATSGRAMAGVVGARR